MLRKARVYNNDIFAGFISEEDGGGYSFIYSEEYFINVTLPAISLTLPKTHKQYKSKILFPFFFSMLSEGANKKVQERVLKIGESDYFGLLLKTAAHETIGAIRVEEIDEK